MSFKYGVSANLKLVAVADGSWSLFKLESPDDTTVELNIASDSLCLSSLSFDTSSSEASILSCTSTLVLFAGISKSPREIVLILWDLQYSVVLASQTLPLPSQSSSNNEPVALQLLPASSSHVFLVISPTPRKRSNGGALKSSVFLVPVTAGKSTIANAMGCASAGAQWVAAEDVSSSKHSSTQIELLASIQKSIEAGRPEAASKTFLAWIAKATETSEEKVCHLLLKSFRSGLIEVTSESALGILVRQRYSCHRSPTHYHRVECNLSIRYYTSTVGSSSDKCWHGPYWPAQMSTCAT